MIISDGDFVRLTGSPNEWEGRVEIYHRGEWRSVCGDIGWSLVDANVVCKELGFLSATNALQSSQWGTGDEPVWLSNVRCAGEESSLSQCQHDGWGSGTCPDGRRAAISACGIVSQRKFVLFCFSFLFFFCFSFFLFLFSFFANTNTTTLLY